MFETINVLGVLLGLVVPVVNGLVTRYSSVKARAFGQLVLNAVAGFGTEWLAAAKSGTAYDVKAAAVTAGLALVTAIAVEAGIYSPLGVSEWAKRSLRKDDVGLAG